MRRVLGAAAAVVLLAGCGMEATPAQPPDASIAALLLYLAPEQATTPTEKKTGAAGMFVQCRGEITDAFRPPGSAAESAPSCVICTPSTWSRCAKMEQIW